MAGRVTPGVAEERLEARPRARAGHAPLVALVVIAAALRFATLSSQSFDLDESVTLALLHHGFSGMLNSIPATESTPPLYYVLAWVWTKVFGVSEFGLRSLSALTGTAMIPLVYVTARRLVSRRAALIASALAAVSPWLIWYSQEARAYSLFALLSLASFYAFLIAADSPSTRALAGWAILSALALASHYFAVFLLAPEALWLLARKDVRRRAFAAVGFVGLVGLALLPLAIEQSHGIKAKAGFLQTPLSSRITAIPTRFLLGEAAPSSSKTLLVTLALLLVAAGVLFLLRGGAAARPRLLWVALSVAVLATLVPTLMALAGRDYLDARNLVGTWAPLVIVLATGYAATDRLGLLAGTALVVLFLAMVIIGNTDTAVQRTDYRGIAAALRASPGPGERAIVVSPDFNWTPLAHYLPGYPQLGPGNVGVREVDLIGWNTQALSPRAQRTLGRYGFRRAATLMLQKLKLVRFAAATTRSIPRAELLQGRLGDGSATVLIQARDG
jgi:mannosyltransferase